MKKSLMMWTGVMVGVMLFWGIYMGVVRYSQSASKQSERGIEAASLEDELPDVRDFSELVRQLDKGYHDYWNFTCGTLSYVNQQTVDDNIFTGKPESQVEENKKSKYLWPSEAEIAEILQWLHKLKNEMENIKRQSTTQDIE